MKTRSGFQSSKQPSKSPIIDDRQPEVLKSCKRRKTTTSVKLMHKFTETENGEQRERCEKFSCNPKELGHSCMTKWCPNVSVSEQTCPVCCNNCNCKSCLPREDLDKYSCAEHEKIEYSKRILKEVFPLVTSLNQEQLIEKEIEANLKGLSVTELQLEVSDHALNENINCGNCGAYIFDMHRSCECGYVICLVCCQILHESSVDGIIRCPPIDIGGCGFRILELQHLMPVNWVDETLERAKGMYTIYDTSETCVEFCSCHENGDEICYLNHFYTLSAHEIESVDMQHFQLHWSKGEPVLVNDVISKSAEEIWEPMMMWRAFHEITKKDQSHSHAYVVKPVNCENSDKLKMDLSEFLNGYLEEQYSLKLEDWKPSCLSDEKWPKQFVEFIKCLPFKDYTHPRDGYLNVYNKLSDSSMKLEMGPRVDISYKQTVTMLHCDKSDMVSVLTHLISPTINDNEYLPEFGAVWEIYRKQDIPTLVDYLRNQATKPVVHPIHDRMFYLDEFHKKKLKHEYGIEPWTVQQKLGDAIFVPAGCPYQVRNLKTNTKVKLNFVSPESLNECIRLQHEFQALPKRHKVKTQMINIGKIMINALDHAIACLAGAIRSDELQLDNEPEETQNGEQPEWGNECSMNKRYSDDDSAGTLMPIDNNNEDSGPLTATVRNEEIGPIRPNENTVEDVGPIRPNENTVEDVGPIRPDENTVEDVGPIRPDENTVEDVGPIRPNENTVEDVGPIRPNENTVEDVGPIRPNKNTVEDVRVWNKCEVGHAEKEVLEAIERRYPTTFKGIRIKSKGLLVPAFNLFCVFIKKLESVLKTCLDAIKEDQITALRKDLNEIEEDTGFDLSWARHRVDKVEELKHGNNVLLNELAVLDECLPTLKKKLVMRTVELVQAHKNLEKAQLELDDATESRNNKARQVAQMIAEASDSLI